MNNLERFKTGKIVLRTPTQELYDRLMQWCDKEGLWWSNGAKALSVLRPRSYGNGACVGYKAPIWHRGLTVSPYEFYKNYNYTIVTLTNKDFEEEHQMTKEDLKVGQVVELRNGDKHLVYPNCKYPKLMDGGCHVYIGYYNIDLIRNDGLLLSGDSDYDITKVYTTSDLVSVLSGNYDSLELIWSRENPEVIAMKTNVAKMEAELESMKESLRKMEEM